MKKCKHKLKHIDIMSIEQFEDNKVKVILICTKCGYIEEQCHYLYNKIK